VVVRNLLATKGNVALVGPRFFACEQSYEFFGVSAPSSIWVTYTVRGKGVSSWRARVERRSVPGCLDKRSPISWILDGPRSNRLNRFGAQAGRSSSQI
jgi:hypothetical protein